MWFSCITILGVQKYSINLYNWFDLIKLLYTFLVISFDWYREQTICLISFNKFFGLLPAFTCARAIVNLWSICWAVNILSPVILVALSFALDTIGEEILQHCSLLCKAFQYYTMYLFGLLIYVFCFLFFSLRFDLNSAWSFFASARLILASVILSKILKPSLSLQTYFLFVLIASWFWITSIWHYAWSLIVFICFSKALPRGEKVNLACSIILFY